MKTIYCSMLMLMLMLVVRTMTNVQAQSDQTADRKLIRVRSIVHNDMVELRCCLTNLNPPFSIERSFNGEDWNVIGNTENRSDNNEFVFTDSTPVMGLSFYRVVSAQPLPERSNTISVILHNNSYIVYPNVANEKMTICNKEPGAKDIRIQIVDLNGILKKEIKTTLSNLPIELDLTEMQKGTYILKIVDAKKTYAYKLFVLKQYPGI